MFAFLSSLFAWLFTFSRKQHPRRRRSVREVGPVVDREGAVDDVGEEELDRRVGHHLAP